ncbi:hypothetical protein BDV98DRAFT_226085 [Pterulicium gracile]|uniref:Uncharacterized protein n=1 Tax=Pterulicium gracile TaxID=1884261 RepID=A0A5C3QW40_9AGAR|nr:hypothetical protein BDV98DRAFT_226085 [Pterula gracilis]
MSLLCPARPAQVLHWLRRSQTQLLQIDISFGSPDELAMLTLLVSAVHRWETVVFDLLDSKFPRSQYGVGSLLPWYFHRFDEDVEDDDGTYSESSESSSSNTSSLRSELDDESEAFRVEERVPIFLYVRYRHLVHTTAHTLQLTSVSNLRSMKVHFGASWPEIDMQLARIAN